MQRWGSLTISGTSKSTTSSMPAKNKRWTFNRLLPAWADGGINGHVSERAHHAVAVTVTVGIAGP